MDHDFLMSARLKTQNELQKTPSAEIFSKSFNPQVSKRPNNSILRKNYLTVI